MTRRILLLTGLTMVAVAALGAAPPGRTVTEEQVRDVAANLRCVVCQSLSVADSPSAACSASCWASGSTSGRGRM